MTTTINQDEYSRRLAACDRAVTLDDKPARIVAFKESQAIVRPIDPDLPDAVFSWDAAIRICLTHRAFKS